MKITKCEPFYTGGGIYLFYGDYELDYDTKTYENGLITDSGIETCTYHFIADGSLFDVALFNEDLFQYGDEMYDICGDGEWFENHLIDSLKPQAALRFFNEMLDWIKANEPDGNYAMSELEIMQDEVNELLKTCYDENGNEIVQWR